MRARLVLEIMGDDGEMIAMETVADLVKVTKGAEDLGLSLSEAKGLLTKLQQAMVETQVELWLSENRELDGRRLRSKGSYPITFHTLFGDVRLKSPRYYLPHSVGGNDPATISPLRKLIPDRPSASIWKRGGHRSSPMPPRPSCWPMCCRSRAAPTPRRFGSTPCRPPGASSGN